MLVWNLIKLNWVCVFFDYLDLFIKFFCKGLIKGKVGDYKLLWVNFKVFL